MAFNWQTFRTRALTAVVFVAVMLLGLLWDRWSFLVLFSIIHFGCWWEYLQLLEKIHNRKSHPYIKLGLMVLGYGLMLLFCGPYYHINGYGLKENISLPVSIAGFAMLIIGIFQKHRIVLKLIGTAALGLLYISLSWGLMIFLTHEDSFDFHFHDALLVLPWNFLPIIIIASIWINDTMAYIVGSLIGKTPISKISPKKTWEGTVGGIILSVVVMVLVAKLFMAVRFKGLVHEESFEGLIGVISFVTSVAGTFGDLFESKLKRMAGVKDSGSFMPGHGGFLDRFDSLLFAVFCVGLGLFLLTGFLG